MKSTQVNIESIIQLLEDAGSYYGAVMLQAANIVRNGQWGTCSGCPTENGIQRPEKCVFYDRVDHRIGENFLR